MTTLHLVFPTPPRELHPNSRSHWRTKAKGVKSYRHEVAILAQSQSREKLSAPVTAHLAYCFRNVRNRDEDNLIAWFKAGFDGLVDAKILPADDSKSLHVDTPTVVIDRTLKAPEIRLTLRDEA